MTKGAVLAFSVSAVLSGVVGYAGISRAVTDVRAPGFACRAVDGRQEGLFVNQGNISTLSNLNVACPVPDVANGVHNITTVNVAFNDPSATTAPSAQRCVSVFAGSGTSCGPVATLPASIVGFFTLNPAKNADWTAPNFGYISVVLPLRPSAGATATTVRGIHAF